MKKIDFHNALLWAVMLVLLAFWLWLAFKPSSEVEIKTPAEIPVMNTLLMDQAKVLGKEGQAKVLSAIEAFNQATQGQVAVLTVPSLDGEPIEDFSIRVAEKWKIGHQGKDNGVIFILAVQDKASRLEVGYGWEGDITDGQAGAILRSNDVVIPLRAGDYTAATLSVIAALRALITKEQGDADAVQSDPSAQSQGEGEGFSDGLVGLILGLISALAIWFTWRAQNMKGGGKYGDYGNMSSRPDRSSSRTRNRSSGGGGGTFGGGGSSGSW